MMISTVSTLSPSMASSRVAPPSKNQETQRQGIKILLPLRTKYELLQPLSSKSTEDLIHKLAIQSVIVKSKEVLQNKMEPDQFNLLNNTELHPDENTPFEILKKLHSWLELMGCDEAHIKEAKRILSKYNTQAPVPAKAPLKETAQQVIQILKEGLVPLGFVLPKKPRVGKARNQLPWMQWNVKRPEIPALSSEPSSPEYKTNAPLIKQAADAYYHKYGFEEFVPKVDCADETPEFAYRMIPQLYLEEGEGDYIPMEKRLLNPAIVDVVDKIDSLIRRKED